jgi:sugar-phosphatase
MTTREVTEFWYSHFPWSGKSLEQVEIEAVERVEFLVSEKGEPMEGVKEILDFCQNQNLKIDLSTNAPFKLISVVLSKPDIAHYFQATSSSEHEIKGEPHLAVYLSTANKLNTEPSNVLHLKVQCQESSRQKPQTLKL